MSPQCCRQWCIFGSTMDRDNKDDGREDETAKYVARKGDYEIQVHIIEARGLKGK